MAEHSAIQWTRRRTTFDIHASFGKAKDRPRAKRTKVTGYIIGAFGIDNDPRRREGDNWYISHLKTGLLVGVMFSFAQAVTVAQRLTRRGGNLWNYSRLKFGRRPNDRSKIARRGYALFVVTRRNVFQSR
jgi:hypothetical protein